MVTRITSRQHAGFTLIEMLVVFGIIAVLAAFLMPMLEKARESANTVRCASNLNQIGIALLNYANNNHNQFPRTLYDPTALPVAGTNPAAPDPFGAGGPAANDVTAAIFLLSREMGFPVGLFNDPYTDEIEGVPDPAPNLTGRSNFSDYKNNLCYSYANPYPSAAAVTAGFQLTHSINPAFVLAADMNPGIAGKNSRNHEGRGQNVLFADNHVNWEIGTKVGIQGDDIYTNADGHIWASPVDGNDSVLLPTDK
jgi:prepilin-type N-terminal cleavage/methylation domain-containing protein